MSSRDQETYFVITYRDARDNKPVSVKAHRVTDSSLGLSFIAVSDFYFADNALVVNPEEEQQRKRFENVKQIHLSIYSVIAIEEVGKDHRGLKFKKDKSNIVVLPGGDSGSS